MAVFFNGRLWTTPAVMSLVDDSAMYNKNLSVGNIVAFIGRSEGGEPFVPLRFGSPHEARAVLRSGDLLKACEKAFDPSSQTVGPTTIICFRVNPATMSELALKDQNGTEVIDLVSSDYGRYTAGIKIKIESASEKGKKITTQFGNAYYSNDNIYRDAFSAVYTGAEESAAITITGTHVVLEAPTGTTAQNIDLHDYETIGQVVDVINATPGFDAAALDGNGEKPAYQGLDFVDRQNIKTAPYIVTADLQAIVDWINGQGEGFVSATRKPNAGAVPANINWTYLAGGGDGIVTMAEWQQAFSALQTEDVQWLTPLSPSPAIHAMADTHCTFMSNIARMERRCFVGTAEGTTDDQAIAAAKMLNSDRTSLVHLSFYDYDDKGRLKQYPPYMMAAQIAGAFSGVNPGTALTNKALKIRGLERKLRNPTDTDRLINGGVLAVEDTHKGFKVVRSVTTWRINNNYNRVEISVGAAVDFVARAVRNALEDFIGAKGSPETLTQAIERTATALKECARPEPMGPGVLVGDQINPPYKNITAEIEGDVMRVEFQCSPVIPINYIPIVIHAVPWSGKVTMAH